MVMEAAAKSTLKDVTLEPGSKSPHIIFNDCDLEQAVNWAAHGILYVACCAGSRIFVQSGIYDEFLKRFTECTKNIKVCDPFAEGIDQGPQVSAILDSVGVVIKFEDEEDVIRQANDTDCKAGTVWVNCANQLHANVPFGDLQSGIGRELGTYTLHK
ncbi:Aldedh-domain-containing protein [Hymenopellis radicata]|nr:Aldedh-domain-containing protein [Hymenopellis radicata]